MMKKISEWLSDIDGHEIVDTDKAGKDFYRETKRLPGWPTHTAKETWQTMKDRGLGGTLDGDMDMAYGYEIAAWLAHTYVDGFRSRKQGRGSSFRDCLEALRSKNL